VRRIRETFRCVKNNMQLISMNVVETAAQAHRTTDGRRARLRATRDPPLKSLFE